MSASSPSSTFSTSASTVASPHSTRCSPQIQRSPGRLIGSAGGSGASSSVSRPARAPGQQPVEFGVVEAEQIEVEGLLLQRRQLGRQHLVVPAGVGRDLVVGDHQRAPLRRRQVRQHDHRHLGQPQLARGQHPAVAGNDHAVVADQHRVDEPELGDRSRDLRHLLLGMGAGIARVRDQSLERPALDLVGKLQVHCSIDAAGTAGGWYTGGTVPGGTTLYHPVYHLAVTRRPCVQKRPFYGAFRGHGAPAGVVTGRGGNSNFAADGSEVPGRCPPHRL